MSHTVYIESSIPSYLTAKPSRDIRTAAWQQITLQWWEESAHEYELFVSELVIAEVSRGDQQAARRRLECLKDIKELVVDKDAQRLAEIFIEKDCIPASAEADALHVAIAAVHGMDYLLTWNCRHIDNPKLKPIMRITCRETGYYCPEICTPLELLPEEGSNNVQR